MILNFCLIVGNTGIFNFFFTKKSHSDPEVSGEKRWEEYVFILLAAFGMTGILFVLIAALPFLSTFIEIWQRFGLSSEPVARLTSTLAPSPWERAGVRSLSFRMKSNEVRNINYQLFFILQTVFLEKIQTPTRLIWSVNSEFLIL